MEELNTWQKKGADTVYTNVWTTLEYDSEREYVTHKYGNSWRINLKYWWRFRNLLRNETQNKK